MSSPGVSSRLVQEGLFQIDAAHQLAVAAAALHVEDAGALEGLAGGGAAGRLLGAGGAEPLLQAVGAAQRVRLQLAGDAVAPVRGDLVDRLLAAAAAVAEHGVRRHGHNGGPPTDASTDLTRSV